MFFLRENLIFNVILAVFCAELMLWAIKWLLRALMRVSGGIWLRWGKNTAFKISWTILDLIVAVFIIFSIVLFIYGFIMEGN